MSKRKKITSIVIGFRVMDESMELIFFLL